MERGLIYISKPYVHLGYWINFFVNLLKCFADSDVELFTGGLFVVGRVVAMVRPRNFIKLMQNIMLSLQTHAHSQCRAMSLPVLVVIESYGSGLNYIEHQQRSLINFSNSKHR